MWFGRLPGPPEFIGWDKANRERFSSQADDPDDALQFFCELYAMPSYQDPRLLNDGKYATLCAKGRADLKKHITGEFKRSMDILEEEQRQMTLRVYGRPIMFRMRQMYWLICNSYQQDLMSLAMREFDNFISLKLQGGNLVKYLNDIEESMQKMGGRQPDLVIAGCCIRR